MKSALTVEKKKKNHQCAVDVWFDLPCFCWTWRVWAFPLRGLLFDIWITKVNPTFASCIFLCSFQKFAKTLSAISLLKSAIRKLLSPVTHKEEKYGVTTVKVIRLTQNIAYFGAQNNVLLAIFISSSKFGNFWICHFMSLGVGTGLNGMHFLSCQVIHIPVITVIVSNLVHSCQIEVTCGCSCEAELLFAGIQCIVWRSWQQSRWKNFGGQVFWAWGKCEPLCSLLQLQQKMFSQWKLLTKNNYY